VAVEVGITTFFANGGTLLLHWLFSFKYWVISLEIPKVLKATETTLQSSETKYNILNSIGILVNLLFSIWVAVRRGQLSAQSAGKIPPHSLVMEVKQLYHAVTVLELLSGVLLGDALRRIKKQLN